MNFLTQTFSSLTGVGVPYTFGKVVELPSNSPQSPWIIYEGTKKDDGSPVTIFYYNEKLGQSFRSLALNALRNMRSIRLPNILKVIDTNEGETPYIVTERVTPLVDIINEREISTDTLLLVLYYVSKALKFLNVEGSAILTYLSIYSVFINENGEIRLGGFEVLYNLKTQDNIIRNDDAMKIFDFLEGVPPEMASLGYGYLNSGKPETQKVDSWRLAVFMQKLFDANQNKHFDINNTSLLPKSLIPAYKNLIRASPSLRASVDLFLKNGEKSFFNTRLIGLYKDLDEFQFKTEEEKLHTFEFLDDVKDDLLPGLIENKIIPEIGQFFTQYPTHAGVSLRLLLSLSDGLPKDKFSKLIKPIIIKGFTLPDRSIRVLLLSSISNYIEKLDRSDITDKIFQNFVTGFADSNPAIREETIKATLYIAPKLTERQLNNELLRFLAKTQTDEKPEIRTNTTILIGKIAEYLNKSSRPNVLATAFSKGLKDPFIHSRIAAILAISSCIEYFTPEIISNKILTVIAPSLLDKSSKVREEAQKAFDLFFQKIKLEASKLPVDKEEDSTVEEVTANVQNFGLNISNAFSKFAGLNGSDSQLGSSSVPDLSRSGTPSTQSLERPAQLHKQASHFTPSEPAEVNTWDDFDDVEVDESWVVDEEVQEPVKPAHQPTANVVRPKVTRLATSESNQRKESPVTKQKKTLQLKPKSKIKLQLEVDEDDGWGDGW